MKLTREQSDIINSSGNIKINAIAGSGKTTTIIEYAKTRPRNSKMLYLAFNRSVKLEAVKKFADRGITNVKVETAHSLAYKHIVFKYHYKVRSQGYKTYEIAELLGLRGNGEKHAEYIIANHINKFITYFCNSAKPKVKELNYLDIVSDTKAKTFVKSFYGYIEKQCRLLLKKMDEGDIEITHDFYLKKFQLSNPALDFNYILFDEGQDASPAMLDVFLKQGATKVIVGDTHQQIYSWRHAVNSLEHVNFKTYALTSSFRFGPAIAHLATEILKWKNHLFEFQPLTISGRGKGEKNKVKAVLARTNLGLLLKAIEHVIEKREVKNLYFEGNIQSYTYAEDGASLYDVLNLYCEKHYLIKDKLIRKMKDFNELEDYIEKTEDLELAMMVELVKEYGSDIPGIIKEIKEKHIKGNNKEKADMIFSTVHRAKGMEYDNVQLVNDFITEEKLEKPKVDADVNISKLNEEINLLYVAITRTRNSLQIPSTLIPEAFPESPEIHVLPVEIQEENILEEAFQGKKATNRGAPPEKSKERVYSYAQVRKGHTGAYKPWTPEMDEDLTVMYCEGESIIGMAKHFGRTKGAIRSRIKKLELEDLYG